MDYQTLYRLLRRSADDAKRTRAMIRALERVKAHCEQQADADSDCARAAKLLDDDVIPLLRRHLENANTRDPAPSS